MKTCDVENAFWFSPRIHRDYENDFPNIVVLNANKLAIAPVISCFTFLILSVFVKESINVTVKEFGLRRTHKLSDIVSRIWVKFGRT